MSLAINIIIISFKRYMRKRSSLIEFLVNEIVRVFAKAPLAVDRFQCDMYDCNICYFM